MSCSFSHCPLQFVAKEMEQTDILLLGKKENGRCLTGTAILKRNAFEIDVDYEVAEYKNQKLKVIDCSGFGDNCLSTDDEVDEFAGWITKALEINSSDAYSAIVIVLKYGNHVMKEELEGCEALRRIFGQDILLNHGVLLMTGGDNFERDSQKTQCSFEDWCRQQGGQFSELLEDCAGRVVLFDNFTKDEMKKNAQIDSLLECIASLPTGGERYTNELFQRASEERDRALAKCKTPILSETFMDEISLILQKFEELEDLEKAERSEPGAQVAEWAELNARTEGLVNHMQTESVETKMDKFVFKFAKSLKEFVEIDGTGSQKKEKSKRWKKMYEKAEKLDRAYIDAKSARIHAICDGIVSDEGSVLDTIVSLILESYEPEGAEGDEAGHAISGRLRGHSGDKGRKRKTGRRKQEGDSEDEEIQTEELDGVGEEEEGEEEGEEDEEDEEEEEEEEEEDD
ncbi:immune-associated nucleotide-binding protein 10 [Plakobranchus ocellatus]|uniref:Immune-associated nucleotide-binding protein 10 n=1 Tax=Plakobranchus ocellatus TaxID=259542 RepID=A0AAV3ZT07_9GAST|nr:immune-associated nucleotide-binding protein 10 [Plakobranchus ocellatus]